MNELQKKLYDLASKNQKNAHVPYSKAYIGAAVLMADGKMYGGCNVENASYGGTICAERTAIVKAVSEGGAQEIKEVMVVSDFDQPWPPCGFCRQVIAEFGTPKTMVHTANHKGTLRTFKFDELLPHAFGPEHLDK